MSSNNTPFYYEIVTFSFIDIAPVMHEDGTVTGARSARFNGKTIQVEGVQGVEELNKGFVGVYAQQEETNGIYQVPEAFFEDLRKLAESKLASTEVRSFDGDNGTFHRVHVRPATGKQLAYKVGIRIRSRKDGDGFQLVKELVSLEKTTIKGISKPKGTKAKFGAFRPAEKPDTQTEDAGDGAPSIGRKLKGGFSAPAK